MRETLPPPPDQEQRDIILHDLDTTILVEAAAGTGKTTSMVGRMVNLLAYGKTTIDCMAAVTFTRKAAAELRSRFQLHLEHSMKTSQDSLKRIRLKESIDHLERCFIGTIHSFCGQMLRERPIEAGVDIQFVEIDEDEDKELRQKAWRGYISDLYKTDSDVLAELESFGVEIGELEPSFMTICDYPDVENWPVIAEGPPDIDKSLALLENYCSHMEAVAANLPHETGNDLLIPKYRKIPLMLRQALHRSEAHDFVAVFEEFLANAKPLQKFWKAAGIKLDDELENWNHFRDNISGPLVKQWKEYLYGPLLRAVMGGVVYYDHLRAQSGKLNFQDLLLNASKLLRNHAEIRRHFRNTYSHILVDEFQDTDPIQAEVMLYLTSEDFEEKDWKKLKPSQGSLFVVGDPKQSIYRFRRADIITYNRVKEIIHSSGGRIAHLSSNFRTVGKIIDWINDSFNDEFSRYPDYASPDYIPLLKGRPSTEEAQLQGIWQLPIPKQQSKTEKIVKYDAEMIAEFINHGISNGLSVNRTPGELQSGLSNIARAEDFLIITPTMKNIATYNERLNRLGIPTEVTGGGSLNSVPELFHFYTLLKAVTEPYNPIALVAALRGPLFGASDRDLYDFVVSGGEFNFRQKIPAEVDPTFSDRLTGFLNRLNNYSKLLTSRPVIPALEFIIADSGLQLLASAGSSPSISAGALSKTIEILRDTETSLWNVGDYVKIIEDLAIGRHKSDSMPVMPRTESAVRIMNLHKAKGLEAPVVFLADPTGKSDIKPSLRIDRSQNETRGYILISANIQGSSQQKVLAAPKDWDLLSKEEQVFQTAEELRLKYVAATRAGSMMVVSNRPQHANKNPWAFFNPRIQNAGQIQHQGFGEVTQTPSVSIDEHEMSSFQQKILTRFSTASEPSYEIGPVKSFFTGPEKVSYATSEYGAQWGIAVHNMLEAMMTTPNITNEQFMTVTLPTTDLPPHLWQEAIDTVQRVSHSTIWKRALASKEKFVELPFVLCKNNDSDGSIKRVIRGVIDLVFRDPSGWVIVDYKSDRFPESRLDYMVRMYEPQIKGYCVSWTEMTGEPVAEAGLYFTNLDRYVVVEVS